MIFLTSISNNQKLVKMKMVGVYIFKYDLFTETTHLIMGNFENCISNSFKSFAHFIRKLKIYLSVYFTPT